MIGGIASSTSATHDVGEADAEERDEEHDQRRAPAPRGRCSRRWSRGTGSGRCARARAPTGSAISVAIDRGGERQLEVRPRQLPDLAEAADADGARLRLALVEDEVDRVPEGPERGEGHDSTPPAPRACSSALDDEHDQLERGREQDHQHRRRDDVALERRVGEDLARRARRRRRRTRSRRCRPSRTRRSAGPRRSSAAPSAARRVNRICRRVRPMPSAASTISAGTSCSPVATLR